MSSQTQLLACPNCRCTEVQVTAWVDANTNVATLDESPTDYAFCPQCDSSELSASDLITVTEPKPFVEVPE